MKTLAAVLMLGGCGLQTASTGEVPDELANVLGAAEGPGAIADLIVGSLPTLPTALRQELLETIGLADRLQKLVAALTK